MRTTHVQPTAIRAAFENIKVLKSAFTKQGAIIGDHISKALHGKAGIANELDWNVKLSMKTAEALGAPVFNPTKKKVWPDYSITQESCFRERAWNTGTYNKMCA